MGYLYMTLINKACYERGCACYDDRVDDDAVEVVLAQTQEPVATVTSEAGNPDVRMSWWHEPALPVGTKLYTTPPQRTWVGLTDEDISEIVRGTHNTGSFVRAIEAILKEKNA